ncbi:hypothetical protein PICST_48230 [Scheffersomyces stipitis CBS 6054]|uniref:Uncharacterized protein n=1 Tax=Scheffersomyces stipitis (strain ATCC 58785 / CBS 6054 / NBRC 10063 / NRRL Y-11545) TaxID=322104 RepID=A3LX90_PICST|nr:hypothetical protein PICST_48230 [Scheffersomyces stipitis CBS 6054]ABN67422.2 hypothetical protein PICST_48230 [Scheffersomyces stipitis CBS 6054]KAG2732109.1 hypothetical protein G9P44_004526 [Scheffersomyces stipitis]
MLGRLKDSARAQSTSSSILLADNKHYESIDLTKLYESVLKLVILEYCNEARFRTPLPRPAPSPNVSAASSNSLSSSSSKFYMKSRSSDSNKDVKLPANFLANLEKRLNRIAFKKEGHSLDDATRRSFLAFYNELLKPSFKSELEKVNKPEYVVMKFVALANKELVKLDTVPQHDISVAVFKQEETFVQQLIELVTKDKDSEAIIERLQETRDSLKPTKVSSSTSAMGNLSISDSNAQYPKPSFRVTDMNMSWIELLQKLFSLDQVKIQQDVFRLKDIAQEKPLQKDIQQVLFFLDKNLGSFAPESFTSRDAYQSWKERQIAFCEQLQKKYQVPPAMKLLPIPPVPEKEDFYVFPRTTLTRSYFVIMIKLCLELELKENPGAISDPDKTIFSKAEISLLNVCARVWRLDYTTRSTAIFTASHLSGVLKDKLMPVENAKDVGPIDLGATIKIFHYCKKITEDGVLDWDAKDTWSLRDQDEWFKNLTFSYNQAMFSIKDCLQMICSKTVRPKFGPYLAILGDYIESDCLFRRVEESGLVRKWEKKLSKSLINVAGARYAELVGIVPRDDTLNISHVLDISENMVSDIRTLQKRYKNPLLGFLDVSRVVAAVLTTMYSADAKHILDHIKAYAANRGEFIHYGDAMEAYKSLSEIRFIHNQVSEPDSAFKFNLENFFYPYLESWADESGQKIYDIVNRSIEMDSYEPIDLERDDKKYSSSVLDMFSLIKQFLNILKSLNWANEYQLAKVYTKLLKSISDGTLHYANSITEKIIKELDEEEQKRLLQLQEAKLDAKKGGAGGWLNEVKSVVSNIQNSSNKLDLEEPYNFKPETCVALNNLSAMMEQLARLEDVLDPEQISNSVSSYDPKSKKSYSSHVVSLRLIRAENLKTSISAVSGAPSTLRPYVTLIDTAARKTIGKTRTMNHTTEPEWDEEFEMNLHPNTSLTISATVWDEKFGTHSLCGRALIQLDPRRFKHDGIPQEIYLDLDTQGRLLIEIAVESEREDAVFVMGRAFRTLKRSQERCIKLIVEKFSRFIHYCFSRSNLRSICGNNGNLKPTEEQVHDAMMPLYDYLNMNLKVLAEYLTNELLLKVMLAAWIVVLASADELLLPKLASAKTFQLTAQAPPAASGWQTAVSSAVANITSSIGISGFGKMLTNNELETVFLWLHFLCKEFFHNDGYGLPMSDLKNEQYQALLVLPVYYDSRLDYLEQEVDRLSPAFVSALRNRNNFDNDASLPSINGAQKGLSRAGSLIRSKTIMANATSKSREKAMREAREARSEIVTQTTIEDIILRILIIKGEQKYVAKRLDQREKLAHSIATQRLAREAAEGRFR